MAFLSDLSTDDDWHGYLKHFNNVGLACAGEIE